MNEHNPIQVLLQEHEVISSAGGLVESLHKLWEHDPEGYAGKVKELIRFFRLYSDKIHHYKEEQILFEALRIHPAFMLGEIITELEEHHELFRDMVGNIEKAMVSEDWPKAQSLLKTYINNLLDHIAVENDELFIMAESLFSPAELERMYFQFGDFDREFGEALKKELEGILVCHN